MTKAAWKIPYKAPEYPEQLRRAGFGPLLAAVLALRNVRAAEDARELICGGEECLNDPLLMTDMAKGRDRLLRAFHDGETVAVFGDYDVDGITSTCILTDYIRSWGLVCHPYIPDRGSEGYGLNCAALDSLRARGVTLVVTVDCGITAIDAARHARDIGMDMIITDHHECMSSLPEAAAVIDCRRSGDNYPNSDLAGVGVAMKLVCACEGEQRSVMERYGDLAAIGTVADVMPLNSENRYIVRRGLEILEKSPRPGISALFREAGVNTDRISASTLSFSLAPHLNAAGRLGSPMLAARLLMSRTQAEAAGPARELCQLNRSRKSIENQIWQEASALLSGSEPDAPIVLASDNWHQGVIGIAASRITERYALPAVMICLNGDQGKGSCRSCEGFNIHDALSACSEYLLGFGGHALAAGLTISADRIDSFREALEKYYREHPPQARPGLRCDLLINDPTMLSIENVRSLDLLEPYGSGNPRPMLCILGSEVLAASTVGGGKHLRMRVRLGGESFECIFFSHTAEELGLCRGQLIDLAFQPRVNQYRGFESVQLHVAAVRPHEPEELCRLILDGDPGAVWAAAPYCPERADFVRAWPPLRGAAGPGENLEAVLALCPAGMEKERFCVCVRVFYEAGLLSGANGVFGASVARIEGKADLEATGLMQSLRGYRAGRENAAAPAAGRPRER